MKPKIILIIILSIKILFGFGQNNEDPELFLHEVGISVNHSNLNGIGFGASTYFGVNVLGKPKIHVGFEYDRIYMTNVNASRYLKAGGGQFNSDYTSNITSVPIGFRIYLSEKKKNYLRLGIRAGKNWVERTGEASGSRLSYNDSIGSYLWVNNFRKINDVNRFGFFALNFGFKVSIPYKNKNLYTRIDFIQTLQGFDSSYDTDPNLRYVRFSLGYSLQRDFTTSQSHP